MYTPSFVFSHPFINPILIAEAIAENPGTLVIVSESFYVALILAGLDGFGDC
jgi:hypothetical protein